MEESNKASVNYGLYLLDQEYKESTNLAKYVREAQAFYNGNQYEGDNDDNMIRVTMNFCSFSSNIKAAKINGTPLYITFTADDSAYDCRKLQRFDEYNQAKLDEKTQNFQTLLDGFNNGTAISGYRWDKDDTTYKGIYKGGLVREQFDILGFAVANPYLQEIQNQKWVMYWLDADVQAVRDMVERASKKDKENAQKAIKPDAQGKDSVNHGLATVYTRYFRIKGEVAFMCSTKDVDLFEYPHFLNPKVDAKIAAYAKKMVEEFKDEKRDGDVPNPSEDRVQDLAIDYEDMIMNVFDAEVETDESYRQAKEKFYLYPFASFAPFAINGSFYGRSDIKGLIPTQKAVNFAISMVLKCVENNAYNKIFAKDGALAGQVITNEPGQIVYDMSRMTNGWGIKMAESQPIPNGVIDFAKQIFDLARVTGGFNDVMDGSVSNQDISGYAVQQMIKQANSSIEQQQQLFWKFCKDMAAIRLMFYKFYVDEAKYTYELPDYEVQSREEARNRLLARQQSLQGQGGELEVGPIDLSQKTRKTQIREFSGKEIFGTNFDISIDVMQGLADSKLAEAQMWDTLIMNGNIQNMEPEMLELYLEANPTVSPRAKATLKAIVERQKQSENAMLKDQLAQAEKLMGQLVNYARELEAQNGYATNYAKNLTKEFTEKIGVANKVITAQNKALTAKAQGASEGEVKSNAARGIAAGQEPIS